jgi:hypothetical protein
MSKRLRVHCTCEWTYSSDHHRSDCPVQLQFDALHAERAEFAHDAARFRWLAKHWCIESTPFPTLSDAVDYVMGGGS